MLVALTVAYNIRVSLPKHQFVSRIPGMAQCYIGIDYSAVWSPAGIGVCVCVSGEEGGAECFMNSECLEHQERGHLHSPSSL